MSSRYAAPRVSASTRGSMRHAVNANRVAWCVNSVNALANGLAVLPMSGSSQVCRSGGTPNKRAWTK